MWHHADPQPKILEITLCSNNATHASIIMHQKCMHDYTYLSRHVCTRTSYRAEKTKKVKAVAEEDVHVAIGKKHIIKNAS